MDWAETTARRHDNNLIVGNWRVLYYRFYGSFQNKPVHKMHYSSLEEPVLDLGELGSNCIFKRSVSLWINVGGQHHGKTAVWFGVRLCCLYTIKTNIACKFYMCVCLVWTQLETSCHRGSLQLPLFCKPPPYVGHVQILQGHSIMHCSWREL